jgi:3-hydroxyacyl-CoA dehydrogenase
VPVPRPPKEILLAALREGHGVVEENLGASLYDVGDGVLLLEFHTKMNAIDVDVVGMMRRAVERAEKDCVGLVIGNEHPECFSAGANLFAMLVAIRQQQWDGIEQLVRDFQAANRRLHYADVPVVAAPAGLALGGGAEVCLGASAIRAHGELFMGLIEVGVGVIPAGGGTMNLLKRWMQGAPDDPAFDPLPLVRRAFETIALGKIASSAEEARELRFLSPHDGVTLRRENLIHDAKQTVLGMHRAGWRRPRPMTFRLPGRNGQAVFEWFVYNLRVAHHASEHDEKIMRRLANVLCGGDTATSVAVSEEHLLDLEREAFLSLCGEQRTQERMQYMLLHHRPLRN